MLAESNAAAHDQSRLWFHTNYSQRYLLSPSTSCLDKDAMAFHSPEKRRGRQGTPLRLSRTHSASPSYMTPTVSSLHPAVTDDYAVGCSVCGSRTIERMRMTLSRSPPKLKCRRQGPTVDRDSGAYTQLLEVATRPADTYTGKVVKHVAYIEGGQYQSSQQSFNVVEPPTDSDNLVTTVLYNEVYPAAPPPLTPLNFEEARLLQESMYRNGAAAHYVREEQRKRVVVRRAEYSNRDLGVSKLIQAVTGRQHAEGSRKEGRPTIEVAELTAQEEELVQQILDSPRKSGPLGVSPQESPIKLDCSLGSPLFPQSPTKFNRSHQAFNDCKSEVGALNKSVGYGLSLDTFILLQQEAAEEPCELPRITLDQHRSSVRKDSWRTQSELDIDLRSPVSATSLRTNKTAKLRSQPRSPVKRNAPQEELSARSGKSSGRAWQSTKSLREDGAPEERKYSGDDTSRRSVKNSVKNSVRNSVKNSARKSTSKSVRKSASKSGYQQIGVENSVRKVYYLLKNTAVIKGLRLLGGFSQYLEREGLIDLE